MNVKELREVLEEAEGILAAAGANGPRKEFRTFLELFKGHDDRSVADFLAELREHLNSPQPLTESQPRRLDEKIVLHYVQRLRNAGAVKSVFDGVYADLSDDTRVRKEEADAIAHQYTGGRHKWPKKAEALTAITDWFAHSAYQAVKMKQVDKATPV
jgi:hypothetical protein